MAVAMSGMCTLNNTDYILLPETPSMHAKKRVAEFIQQEITRPSKQWICNILNGSQESDEIIMRTEDFVLLPDTERVNRYWRIQSSKAAHAHTSASHSQAHGRHHVSPRRMLNWLCILYDRGIHTMRDLRGKHVPMLKGMLASCMKKIEQNTGIPPDQVMAYVHYPPSVYQLHIHFAYPYGQHCHRDTYRVHSLAGIINNLEIDPEYYAKATLQLALYRQSLHYAALVSPDSDEEVAKEGPRA